MGRFLAFIYQVLIPFLLIPAYLLTFFIKSKSFTLKSFKKRIFIKLPGFKEKTILFHCSSIGEINAIKELILVLREKFPQTPIVITTFTETALNQAEKITQYSYLIPFDIKFVVKKFLKKINPFIVFIAETEIWPNFIIESSKISRVFIVNGRISEKSFKKYLLIKPLISYIFKSVEKIFVQSEDDFNRFSLFYPAEKIIIAGNTKYDAMKVKEEDINYENELKKLDFQNKKIITFGSVHPGEFETIIKSFKLLKEAYPDIRYIIVPRHIEKIDEFKKIVEKSKIRYAIISEVEKKEDIFKDFYDTEILLVDKIGVLLYFYSISIISFVGGTLNNIGGHNLIEPSVYSKPVIFGPNYFNQKLAAQKLIENGGGFIVSDEFEIAARIKVLLSDENKHKNASLSSKKTLLSLQGATKKITDEVFKNN